MTTNTRSEHLRAEHRAGALWLTLDRPEKKNALSSDLLAALSETLGSLMGNEAIRVVVLRGRGEQFSAGLDLRELFSDRAAARKLFEALNDACLAIRRARQAVVASIDGPCVAGALQLVACCDLAIASSRAKFKAPGATLGFFHSTPAVPLTRSVAPKHAMELLLTADFVSAERAREMAIVNWVVAPGELEAETERVATRLAGLPGLSESKADLYAQHKLEEERAYASFVDKMMAAWETGEPRRHAERILGEL